MVEKYLRDLADFCSFIGEQEITMQQVQAYRDGLIEKGLAKSSVNSMMISLNSYFRYIGRPDLKVTNVETKTDVARERLTAEEAHKLLIIAEREGKGIYKHLIQTICETGLRISELSYITIDALYNRVLYIRHGSGFSRIELKTPLPELLLLFSNA